MDLNVLLNNLVRDAGPSVVMRPSAMDVLGMLAGLPTHMPIERPNVADVLASLPTYSGVQRAATVDLDALRAENSGEFSDLQRILDLPVMNPLEVPDLTERFRRPGGTMMLRPIQSAALWHAEQCDGLLAPVGVGHGKTALSFLLPVAMQAKRPLLLIPAMMREQAIQDYARYSQHFVLAAPLTVRSYEELSSPTRSGMLRLLDPDLIVADEAHRLRHTQSTRSRRMRRYFHDRPETRFVALSGTMTSRSLKDYVHLARWALREKSPLPLTYMLLQAWCDLLEEGGGERATAQKREGNSYYIAPLCEKFGVQNRREAFKRRLVTAPGVVATVSQGVDASLVLIERQVETPPTLEAIALKVEQTWQAPNGDELEDGLAKVRVMRQLACGFFYYWDWSPAPWFDQPDMEWLIARSAWHKAVRLTLQSKFATESLDSPMLLARACSRGLDVPTKLKEAWEGWLPHRKKRPPPTLATWVDDFLVQDVVKWVEACEEPPIVWYTHRVFGLALAEALPEAKHFADGPEAARDITNASNGPPIPIIASAIAHGHGRNLQSWGVQILANPIAGGAQLEQLVGRSHRAGQLRDEVTFTVYVQGAFGDALVKAFTDAGYIEATTGQQQRLGYAGKVGDTLLELFNEARGITSGTTTTSDKD